MASRNDELVFVPLGGAGEIGMNLSLYGFGPASRRKWLMVDLGLGFAEGDLPGVEIILPDPQFIENLREDLVGIVLTHAHEDHVGAVLDLWPRLRVPIYATPFTATFLEAKAADERGAMKPPVTTVPLGGRIKLGPFEVEFVTMAHSIPEPSALAIRTPAGLVLHSGDWKIDPDPVVGPPADEARLRALGEEGVLALICDSTNALREGVSPSERDVANTLAELIQNAPHRVAVTIFASNVARIRAVAEAAEKADRHVVPLGRSMHRIIQVARETGYLDGLPDFLSDDAYGYLPRDKVVALCTGSQGEPRAALARISAGDHPSVAFSPGDRVIFSSRAIPGNERSVNVVINGLVRRGVEVITDRTHAVHVTGHPRRGELVQFYGWLRPRALVPVHGEELHMAEQAALGRTVGIPDVKVVRNGNVMRLLPGPLAIIGEAPAGRIARDGNLLTSAASEAMRERRNLAFAGQVTVSIVLEGDGELAAQPLVSLVGLPQENARGLALEAIVRSAVDGVLDGMPRARRRDAAALAESARRAVRGAVHVAWGKRPHCRVLVTQV